MIISAWIAAFALLAATWIAIIILAGGWVALALVAVGVFAAIALFNLITYGHAYPPDRWRPW